MFYLSYSHTDWVSGFVHKVLYKGPQIRMHIVKILLFLYLPASPFFGEFQRLCLPGKPCPCPSSSAGGCAGPFCTLIESDMDLAQGNPPGDSHHAPSAAQRSERSGWALSALSLSSHRLPGREGASGRALQMPSSALIGDWEGPWSNVFVQRSPGRANCIPARFLLFLTHFVIWSSNWLWHWFLPGGSSALYQQEVCLSCGCYHQHDFLLQRAVHTKHLL